MSLVPEKGSVGCSGDLTPLAHLTLGLMGEGGMWSARTGWSTDAAKVLALHRLEPLQLGAKEGIALINGTQLIVALGAEAVHRASSMARQADVIAALTLEALRGSAQPFDEGLASFAKYELQHINILLYLHSDTQSTPS